MAVNKHKVMLEKILNEIPNTDIVKNLCDEGKELLLEAAKLVNFDLENLGFIQESGYLRIETDTFDLPGCYFFDEYHDYSKDFEVEIIVKYEGEKIKEVTLDESSIDFVRIA